MSWMERLYRTYENSVSEIGKVTAPPSDDPKTMPSTPLLPICHTTQNAQIEITVDWQGNWVPHTARALAKADGVTVIPCTEDSAGRTSGLCPHPLFDKLQYLAGDYTAFGGREKRNGYPDYMKQLTAWCASPHCHPAVQAMQTYLKKGCLIADLIRDGVLFCTEDGQSLLSKWDGPAEEKPLIFQLLADPLDAFVRFVVSGPEGPCILYQNAAVRESYIAYQAALDAPADLCYVQGIVMPSSQNAPAKIRNTGDKAKLISSNDSNSNHFTYRGRFAKPEQAVSIGFETMHKAHNALKWLIARQGWRNGDQVILVWGTQNEQLPYVFGDSYDALRADQDEDDDLGLAEMRQAEPKPADTFAAHAAKVNLALSGYGKRFTPDTQTAVLALDSTNGMIGRLSVSYYREYGGGELIDRLNIWYATCAWLLSKKKESADNKSIWIRFLGTPAPLDIVYAAYGRGVGDKLKKAAIERLLPCIVDCASLPTDLVQAAARRASAPQSMEEWEWQQTLSVACALIRKACNDRYNLNLRSWTANDITNYKEVYPMALDPNNRERSYLFGRLLAYADQVESLALFKSGEKRMTNAVRLMHQFSVRPASTWRTLDEKLVYYYSKFDDNGSWFRREIDTVISQIAPDDYTNARLDDTYLLGYHSQLIELRRPKDEKNKETSTEGKDEN